MPSSSKKSEVLPETPQALIGFMTNDQWDELLCYVNELIREMEELPLPDIKDKVFELLAGIDSIHRESLSRLVRLFKQGVLEQVVTDPAIHTLMELYDLLPPEREKTQTAAKSSINFPNIPIKVVPSGQGQVPKATVYPHWVPALDNREDSAPGKLHVLEIEQETILLCRIEEEFYAIAGQCSQDNSSLTDAILNSYTLLCSNHPGCLYDVRQGTRIAGEGRIDCYPVKITEQGAVMIGIGMEFTPKLPTF